MADLLRKDLQWILRLTPRRVLEIMKERPGNVFLAGGFIRAAVANEKASDIDLFVPSVDEAQLVALLLKSEEPKAKIYKSDNAFSVKLERMPVQVIHRWTYEKAEDLVESFDFTIAKAAVWFDPSVGWSSLCAPSFYPDLAAKRLTYTSPQRNEDAGGSILRVLKYYQRGYRIPLDSLGAVIARLVEAVDFEKIHEGREETREKQMAKVLTGLLREVDPNIDPSHIAHLPSEDEEQPTMVELEETD